MSEGYVVKWSWCSSVVKACVMSGPLTFTLIISTNEQILSGWADCVSLFKVSVLGTAKR